MHYLEKYQPPLMWIALLDADMAAHLNDKKHYQHALASYVDMLDILLTTLKKLKLDEETTVIVTTDHGAHLPESKQTWAFVFNGELIPVSSDASGKHYSTLSIRKTIEKVFSV